jgi:hypothetical protein
MDKTTRALPSSIVPPYFRVAAYLAGASIVPNSLAPPGYNDDRARLFVRFFKRKTIPTAGEFDAAMEGLYQLLDDAGFPDGLWVGGEHGDVLMTAKLTLDKAFREAYACGLTTTRIADEPRAERSDSEATTERGGVGAFWVGPAR